MAQRRIWMLKWMPSLQSRSWPHRYKQKNSDSSQLALWPTEYLGVFSDIWTSRGATIPPGSTAVQTRVMDPVHCSRMLNSSITSVLLKNTTCYVLLFYHLMILSTLSCSDSKMFHFSKALHISTIEKVTKFSLWFGVTLGNLWETQHIFTYIMHSLNADKWDTT